MTEYVDLEALEKELESVRYLEETISKRTIHIVEKQASEDGPAYVNIIGEFYLNRMGCLADVFEPITDDREYCYMSDKLRELDNEYGDVILEANLKNVMDASLEMIKRGEGDLVFFLIWNSMYDHLYGLDPIRWENIGVLYCPLLNEEGD